MTRRRRRLVLVGVPLVLVTGVVGTSVSTLFLSPPPVAASAGSCLPTVGPLDGGNQDAANLDDEQRGIATRIVQIGQQRQVPPRGWQVAIQAGMTESRLRNVDYGHADSLGIFQMRPSMGWGTVAQVTDVEYQINKFYDVLLELPGWQEMRPGTAAQSVERSAFPFRYHEWEPMAVALVEQLSEVADATGCGAAGGDTSGAARKAIEFALAQQGKPYVWGAKGPDAFDCSGLVLRAYEAAGISVPPQSFDQYQAGAHVPFSQARPGDLVFWADAAGDPEAIHHVGIYLGDNRVVHAPQPGEVVETTTVWQDELVDTVTRPTQPA